MNINLYIAGPMTGMPDLNFPQFFKAEDQLKRAGYAVLNPADRAGRTEGMAWSWYLRRGIRDVTEADGIALLPGWEDSEGARLEVYVARKLRLALAPVDGWVAMAQKLAIA
jgi:hypothetical protein